MHTESIELAEEPSTRICASCLRSLPCTKFGIKHKAFREGKAHRIRRGSCNECRARRREGEDVPVVYHRHIEKQVDPGKKPYGVRLRSDDPYYSVRLKLSHLTSLQRYEKLVKLKTWVFMTRLLSSAACHDCGSLSWRAFTFDHRNPSMKSYEISDLVTGGNLPRLKAEIKKCDIVCANCHLIRSSNMFGHWRSKITDDELTLSDAELAHKFL